MVSTPDQSFHVQGTDGCFNSMTNIKIKSGVMHEQHVVVASQFEILITICYIVSI